MVTTIGGTVDIKGLPTFQPPEMKTYELRVEGSLDVDSIYPSNGHKIQLYGILCNCCTTEQHIKATRRATLCIGTEHINNPNKVLWCCRPCLPGATTPTWIMWINIKTEINEPVVLTNVTYSTGNIISRAIIYYTIV